VNRRYVSSLCSLVTRVTLPQVLTAAPVENRLKRLAVHVLLGPQEKDSSGRTWCLVRDEGDRTEEEKLAFVTTADGYAWLPEDLLKQWEAAGTVVVGRRPTALDAVWSTKRAESEKKIKALEADRKELQGQLEESAREFNKYKTRAQAALKKVSGDDKSERKRMANVEETELEKLTEQVDALQEVEVDLREQIKALESTRKRSEDEAQVSSAKLLEQSTALESLTTALEVAEERLKQAVVARELETTRRLEAELATASLQTQLQLLETGSGYLKIGGSLSLSIDSSVPDTGEDGGKTSSARMVLYDKVSR
jgi:hypothetical protein